ncbi:MAG: UDP-N-acetylglucosamine 1-carboxyvinyltransferase [Leptospirales bacterium]
MDRFHIVGGTPLRGDVKISGAKNAALPILFSTLLGGGLEIGNVPSLRDIRTAFSLLGHLGIQAVSLPGGTAPSMPSDTGGEETDEWSGHFRFSEVDESSYEAPYDLVRTMRASILCLGPLLARRKRARVSLPGGCLIGARPVDMHLNAFVRMGANISIDHGYIDANTEGLEGCDIHLPYPTVTGTENILMAATLAKGTTRIFNAAQEPEVTDLAISLNARGARIEGVGTSSIRIDGVSELSSGSHNVMWDRIEAGTFLVAGALLGDPLTVQGFDASILMSLMAALSEMGASFKMGHNSVTVSRIAMPEGTSVRTEPYPGFPTDMQAQILPLMAIANGSSTVVETVFENRFTHVMEMNRMGANIDIHGSRAFVRGGSTLEGACVMASDLRASAGLVLAGLIANGETVIQRVYHIDRGYERIELKLEALGARIKRVREEAAS